MQRALIHDGLAHMILIAHGDAAGRQQGMVAGRGVGNRLACCRALVGQDAHVGDRTAQSPQQAHHGITVGVIDRAGLERAAGFGHLVAGRKQGDAQGLVAGKAGNTARGGKADVLRLQSAPSFEDGGSRLDVLARIAPVGTLLDA